MHLVSISIIIPVYNVEPYITNCLQSVMRQTYNGPVECILVDDCGQDKSIEVAQRLIDDYTGSVGFKILHHKQNKGLSASRNTGTLAATGDYFYYLDSDDYLVDECLEILAAPLLENDYDMVMGDCKLTSNPYNIQYLCNDTGPIIGNENIFREFFAERTLYMMACNKLFKASLFKEHDLQFLEGQIHEDDLWTYKTALCLESLYVQNVVTYIYRIRPDSITSDYHSRTKLRLSSWMATVDYVLSHPANVRKEYYDKCVVYDFGKVVRFILHDKDCHRNEYIGLRRRFDYHPVKLFIKGRMNAKTFMEQLHLALSPQVGYSYLVLRKIGRRFFKAQG